MSKNKVTKVVAIERGMAAVSRLEGGLIEIRIGSEPPEAENLFAADAACAVLQFGTPELHFVQLNRADSAIANRLVVVRYIPDIFLQRAEANEPFLQETERWLGGHPAGRTAGAAERLAREANKGEAATAIIDADFDIMARVGHSAAITFLTMRHWDRHQITTTTAKRIRIASPIEVTLPLNAVADLLASWRALADKIRA